MNKTNTVRYLVTHPGRNTKKILTLPAEGAFDYVSELADEGYSSVQLDVDNPSFVAAAVWDVYYDSHVRDWEDFYNIPF